MSRLGALLLSGLLVLVVAGCGGSSKATTTTDDPPAQKLDIVEREDLSDLASAAAGCDFADALQRRELQVGPLNLADLVRSNPNGPYKGSTVRDFAKTLLPQLRSCKARHLAELQDAIDHPG